jgi:hypothetical protein
VVSAAVVALVVAMLPAVRAGRRTRARTRRSPSGVEEDERQKVSEAVA